MTSLWGADRPNCPMCGTPVAWMIRKHKWSDYCGSNHCTSPQRICKQCGQTFNRGEGGSKYCSPACRDAWNHGAEEKRYRQHTVGICSYCNEPRSGHNTWDLCVRCYRRIEPVAQRLRSHHVSFTFVHRLLADGKCQNPGCDRIVLGGRNNLTVDHDHACCAGGYSCGLCVRGLLCGGCNAALGHTGDNVDRVKGLAAYLEAWGMTGDDRPVRADHEEGVNPPG